VCYRKLGDDANALLYYEKALEYDSENADSVGLYVSLGSLYIENNKPYTAIDYLEKAAELYPEQPAAHAYLAIAYAMAYEYDKSEEQLTLASGYGYSDIDAVKERIEEVRSR
jgi:tetratricopeptide (TPR) repeat protein